MLFVTTTAGPDSGLTLGASTPLTIGSSAQLAGHIDDPALGSHHFVIGGKSVVVPLQSVSKTPDSDGILHVEAGNSRFVIGCDGESVVRPQPRRQSSPVIRSRRQASTAPVVDRQVLPDPPSRLRMTTFAMPVMSISTAVLITLLTHSWMYLVFGAGAALMGLISAASEVSRYRRDKKEHDDEVASSELKFHIQRAALSEFKKEELRSRWPLDVERWLRSERLWEVRPDHDDFLSCVVGIHVVSSSESATGDPVLVILPMHRVVVVQGQRHASEALIRQLVTQICLRSGPADVCIEANGLCEVPATFREHQHDQSRYTIVLTDDIEGLGTATSELRQRLISDDRVTVIALADPTQQIPSCAEVVIRFDENWRGEVVTDTSITFTHMAGVSNERWHQWSAQLAQLHDPERVQSSIDVLPQLVRLREFARQSDHSLCVEIGDAINGPFNIDLVGDGPHALIAGTTGSGKSEFLRALITALCVRYSSDVLNLVLIDFKGGSTFDEFNQLPHVTDVVSDLDVEQIDRMLAGLQIEIHRREQVLREMNARDIASLLSTGRSLSRLVVIVDEFAVLAHRHPEHMKTFVAIASQGRSLGLHLVLASQRVTGAINDDIRANTDLRIAFRVADTSESRDVVGCAEAAQISKAHPGRALVKGSGGEVVEVQTAVVMNDDLDKLKNLCEMCSDTPARRTWSDALPTELAPSINGIGLIDVPEQQAHIDWQWTPSDGPLSIEGGFGSGTTTALVSVLFHNSGVSAYVIDGRGDDALHCVNDFPNVAPVVFAWDQEQKTRMFQVINTHLADRKKSGDRSPLIVAVDGISELIRYLNDRELDALRSLYREGEGLGICVITTGAEPPIPATTRVVLGCTDKRSDTAQGRTPGRGTLHCHGDRPRELQIRPTKGSPAG
ncbi:MAG: FtsK/SpoIIIE domain-containing protein, partial [Ilumatobacteraceae bacterium]